MGIFDVPSFISAPFDFLGDAFNVSGLDDVGSALLGGSDDDSKGGGLFGDVNFGKDFLFPAGLVGLAGFGGSKIASNAAKDAAALQDERLTASREETELELEFLRERLAADKEIAAAKLAVKKKLAKDKAIQDAFGKLIRAALEGRGGEATALTNLGRLTQGPLGR